MKKVTMQARDQKEMEMTCIWNIERILKIEY